VEDCLIRWDGHDFVVEVDRYTFKFATTGNQRGDAYFLKPISRAKHGTSSTEIDPNDEHCALYQRIATGQLNAAIARWRQTHLGQLITDQPPFILT